MKKYMMELFGTFLLVLLYSMTGNPISIGMMLTVLVYMGAHVSGAHYNPAVSLGMWLRGKLKCGAMWYYMIFQILGGFLAALLYWGVVGKKYYPFPSPGVDYWKIFVVELLFTAFFVFVFLTVFTAKKFKKNGIFGLVVGFALLAILFLGGTYNPAISVGPILLDTAMGGDSYMHLPAYIFGPLGGGLLASLIFRYFYCEEFKK